MSSLPLDRRPRSGTNSLGLCAIRRLAAHRQSVGGMARPQHLQMSCGRDWLASTQATMLRALQDSA
jgi:hypothetical protein